MQRQSLLARAVAAAVLIMMIGVPVLQAEEETPSGSLEARMGRPPGVSSSPPPIETEARMGFPPGTPTNEESAATAPPEARIGRPPGEPVAAQASMWGAFISWLQEQALLFANR